jgi:hypothetical protein
MLLAKFSTRAVQRGRLSKDRSFQGPTLMLSKELASYWICASFAARNSLPNGLSQPAPSQLRFSVNIIHH